jgi:hypothetical protein
VPRQESIHGRTYPAKRRQAGDPRKPREFRQYTEYGQPCIESPQPRSRRSAQMHFPVEIATGKGRLCSHLGIVVIQESQPRVGIVGFDLRARPSAKRAGAVHENVVGCYLGHRPSHRAHLLCHREARWAHRQATIQLKADAPNAGFVFIAAGQVDRPREECEVSMKACPSSRRLCWAQAAVARYQRSSPDVPSRTWGKKLFQCLHRAGSPVRSSRGCSRSIL